MKQPQFRKTQYGRFLAALTELNGRLLYFFHTNYDKNFFCAHDNPLFEASREKKWSIVRLFGENLHQIKVLFVLLPKYYLTETRFKWKDLFALKFDKGFVINRQDFSMSLNRMVTGLFFILIHELCCLMKLTMLIHFYQVH